MLNIWSIVLLQGISIALSINGNHYPSQINFVVHVGADVLAGYSSYWIFRKLPFVTKLVVGDLPRPSSLNPNDVANLGIFKVGNAIPILERNYNVFIWTFGKSL
jgi:hypothetical protein